MYDAQDVHVPVITTLYLREHTCTCVFMGFNAFTRAGVGLTVAVPFDVRFHFMTAKYSRKYLTERPINL